MEIYKPQAALMMRDFRERMNMTLREAAPLLDQSQSALSRKERGEKPVERDDVRNAIEAYALSRWEAYELWLSAGFLPEKSIPVPDPAVVFALADDLMCEITFPACVTDPLGYIWAWNHSFEALWLLTRREEDPVHTLELLFSPRASALLGPQWEAHVQRELYLFYNKTLKIARTQEFLTLIHSLQERYGERFTHMWDAIHQYRFLIEQQTVGVQSCRLSLRHEQPADLIDYLCLRSQHDLLVEYELTVYTPVGSDNMMRFEQWREEQAERTPPVITTANLSECSHAP